MIDRSDGFYTVLTDQDLHDNGITVYHCHANEFITLAIPLNRQNHRSRQLSRSQCRELGTRLLNFARTGQLSEPQGPNDYQI